MQKTAGVTMRRCRLSILLFGPILLGSCASLIDPKQADCEAFSTTYLDMQSIMESDPSIPREKLSPEQDATQWLVDEETFRQGELTQVSERLRALELKDDELIAVRDQLIANVEASVAENIVLLDIVSRLSTMPSVVDLNLAIATQQGDPAELEKQMEESRQLFLKLEPQKNTIATLKRGRSDLVRGINRYCETDLPLPFGS
jgi:hypothetical protein